MKKQHKTSSQGHIVKPGTHPADAKVAIDHARKIDAKVLEIEKTPKKLKIITIIVLSVLVLLSGAWLVVHTSSDSNVSASKNCIDDKGLIDSYNKVVSKISPQTEYKPIMQQVQNKSDAKDDIVCQYIAFDSANRLGDEAKAKAAYLQLKQLSENGESIPKGLIVDSEDIDLILQQYQFYDRTESSQDGAG